ncbi:MAG: MotA/TolQ/ExbB proton channel family protein [Acidobacteria bacterium]|nr:MotA/TolQ/ExbB proton channel family protein [Acidobacteriota bacterium]
MWEFLEKGGWFMVPIGACLLLAMGISIERLLNLRLGRIFDTDAVSRVRQMLHTSQYDGALQVCRSKNLLFNRLLETAIAFRHISSVDQRQLLEDQSRQEAHLLERFLPTLRTVATIAPLLGLLGTVAGMIKVFHQLSIQGMGQAADLSNGISEALITTAAGMCVAIPTIVLHNFFDGRATRLMLRLEKELIEIMLLIRGNNAVPTQE